MTKESQQEQESRKLELVKSKAKDFLLNEGGLAGCRRF